MKSALLLLSAGMLGWVLVKRGARPAPQAPTVEQTAAAITEQIAGVMTVSHNAIKPTRTSARGIELIKAHEGYRASVYRDAAGYPTIGYGHLIKPGESFPHAITEAQAVEILRADLRTAEAAVLDAVRVPLSQAQFDALVSFTFNVGAANLRQSTLLRKLNAGDYEGAAAEFTRWNRAGGRVLPGLVSRRAQESTLFLAGMAGAGVVV